MIKYKMFKKHDGRPRWCETYAINGRNNLSHEA